MHGWQFYVSRVSAPARADCQVHGWLTAWMSEWATEAEAGRERGREEGKCRGERRDVRAAAGMNCCIMDGEVEEWEVAVVVVVVRAGMGSARAEWQPWPSGDINAESHRYGDTLLTRLRPTGCRDRSAGHLNRQGWRENKGQGCPSIHPSIHALTSSLHPRRTQHADLTALHFTFLLTWPLLQPLNGCCWIFDGAKYWIFNI